MSCYTDRLLANRITGKPVRISCHSIMQCELDFRGLTKYLYRLYREICAPNLKFWARFIHTASDQAILLIDSFTFTLGHCAKFRSDEI